VRHNLRGIGYEICGLAQDYTSSPAELLDGLHHYENGDNDFLETLAAVDYLRSHPHGLSDGEFDALFTTDKPIVFAFHGYPWLIHRLTYRRHGHDNLHVRGYKEEGTTTTPFDMTVLNEIDRLHLALDVIHRVPKLRDTSAEQERYLYDRLIEHKLYITRHGDDMPEIRDWKWSK